MKFNAIGLLTLAVCLNGCAAFSLTRSAYDFDVDPNSRLKDEAIEVSIDELQMQNLLFHIRNKGSSSVKVIWDETSFVDTKGTAHRVIHQGVRYIASGEGMPPTLVPPGAQVQDAIGYADGVRMVLNNWMQPELISCSGPSAICDRESNYGRILTVLFTVEVAGKKREYTGKLRIRKARETASAPAAAAAAQGSSQPPI